MPNAANSLMTSPKKPGVAFWATVGLVVVLVLYVLSFGPACWFVEDIRYSPRLVSRIYWPLLQIVKLEDKFAGSIPGPLNWWALYGGRRSSFWISGLTRIQFPNDFEPQFQRKRQFEQEQKNSKR